MKLPKRRPSGNGRPSDSEGIADTVDSLLTACTVVLLLASLGGLAALVSGLHIGLRVGDILAFKPEANVADSLAVSATRADAAGRPGAACTLDPAVMAHDGGSIVVESKSLTQPLYEVHWAGVHTSTGPADCGQSAELTLSRMDLQTLVNAIGGFTFNSRGYVF